MDHPPKSKRLLPILLILLIASAFHGAAANEEEKAQEPPSHKASQDTEAGGTVVPNSKLTFTVPKIAESPRVDGRLNEPFWKYAAKLGNFVEISPGDNVKPKANTEALFAYDEGSLYIGFICYDHSPEEIRASISDRDHIFQDDFIGIILDTFRDQQNGYEFFVNPYGIQGDLSRTYNEEDESFDTVWESGGDINSIGWTAEMAIPFRSLRFPDTHEQEWRIHVIRIRPRDSREQISWAPISRDESCLFCQAGTLRGIRGVNRSRHIEILPYAITSQSGGLRDTEDAHSGFHNEKPHADAGVGLKYGLTPNLTLDFAYNPDFSQIESDAAQIDVNTTFALFYTEKRPFFLEGRDIFGTDNTIVYTRSINDPIAAAKLTGRVGKYTLGYIFAQDENSPYIVPFEDHSEMALGGQSISNIFRLKRDLLSDSYVGLLVTDRHLSSGSNSTLGVDGNMRFHENYRMSGQLTYSYTREPDDPDLSSDFSDVTFGKDRYTSLFDGEGFAGVGATTTLRREARHWNAFVEYADISPTFRAENGFITGNNYRRILLWTGWAFQPNNRILEVIEPSFDWGRKWNHDGVFKDTWISPQLFIRFKKQTTLWLNYLWSDERFKDVLIQGIRRFQGEINTNVTETVSGGVDWRIGRSVARGEDPPILGHERTYEAWATIKPTSRMKIDATYVFSKMLETASGPELFSGYIARSRLTYQFTRRLFLRLVTQYNDFSDQLEIDPLLSYKINPFTVFFLGSTHDLTDFGGHDGYLQTERQFFVKFQYLFRI